MHPRVLAAQLYELHAHGGRDRDYLERWPGDGELYGVLLFAETYADRIADPDARKQADELRITLTEWLRHAFRPLQLRAIDDARSARVTWERIAMALGFVDAEGQPRPGSASNRRDRLMVEVHGTPEDRRQPEVARVIEKRAADEQRERAERERVEDARYAVMDEAARALLSHHARGDLLADPDDDFWWDQLAEVVDDRQNVSERAMLHVYVRGVVRETCKFAERTGRKPEDLAVTEEALRALDLAAELVGEARPSTSVSNGADHGAAPSPSGASGG